MGCKRKNMSNAKRKDLEGRGTVGKTAVVGAKEGASASKCWWLPRNPFSC